MNISSLAFAGAIVITPFLKVKGNFWPLNFSKEMYFKGRLAVGDTELWGSIFSFLAQAREGD